MQLMNNIQGTENVKAQCGCVLSLLTFIDLLEYFLSLWTKFHIMLMEVNPEHCIIFISPVPSFLI